MVRWAASNVIAAIVLMSVVSFEPFAQRSKIMHGVAPAVFESYLSASVGGTFLCFDTSEELPGNFVNDDFCDCRDGSDEPGTAACAGISGASFYCENQHSIPKRLPSSHVRDGICDCCDGSDESVSRYAHVCENTCVAEGVALKAELGSKRNQIIEGLRLRDAAAAESVTKIKLWSIEMENLQKEIDGMEQQKTDLLRSLNVSENDTVANASQVLGLSEEVIFEEDFERGGAPKRWKVIEKGGATVYKDPQRGKVLAMNSCTWGGMAFSKATVGCSPGNECRISFWAKGAPWQGFSRSAKKTLEHLADAHSWLAVPATNEEDFSDRLASTETSSEWTRYEYEFPDRDSFQMFGSDEVRFSTSEIHIMLQSHASTGRCASTMFDDFRIVRLGPLALGLDNVEPVTKEDPLEKRKVSEYARWAVDMDLVPAEHSSQEQGGAEQVENGTSQSSSQPLAENSLMSVEDHELQLTKSAIHQLDRDLRSARHRRLSLEKKLAYIDTTESSRWTLLLDRCVSKQSGDYNYSICFFADAKQGSTSLGTFDKWDPQNQHVMLFKHGHRCHAGPARTLKAHLVCGVEDSFIELSEPSRCEYEATVATPCACDEEDLSYVDEQIELVSGSSRKINSEL